MKEHYGVRSLKKNFYTKCINVGLTNQHTTDFGLCFYVQ